MTRITFVSALILTVMASAASADQCAAVRGKAVADAAAKLIQNSSVVIQYCEPCNEKPGAPTPAGKVSVAPFGGTGNRGYYSVLLNDKYVDLAYVFAKTGPNSYVNVGRAVGCTGNRGTVESVSTVIDSAGVTKY